MTIEFRPGSGRDRFVRFLLSRGPSGATTREIIEATGICAVNSYADDCRERGVPILCEYQGRTPDGGQVYRYRIAEGWRSGG